MGGDWARVRTGLGHGGITCVLKTQLGVGGAGEHGHLL